MYGYQPDERADRASIVGVDGQVLGRGDVVDHVYRIEVTTDAASRRISAVCFDSDDEAAGP